MKKRFPFILFIIVTLSVIGYGIYYIFSNRSSETYEFINDGYALYAKNNEKTESFSFSSGAKYNFIKNKDKVTFDSKDGNVSVDEETGIHFVDNSVMLLKNVVGLDLTTIDRDIIFYYNVYKNTLIANNKDSYTIDTINNEKISFKNMLIRINENKYLLLGDNIRATLSSDEVVDFGTYAYFEYIDKGVTRIYNNNKNYKTLSSGVSIVSGENVIDLNDKTISKGKTKYITLTNLVINNSSNIDLIPQEKQALPDINQSNVDTSGSAGSNSGSGSTGGGSMAIDSEDNTSEMEPEEEIVDPNQKIKQPVFKVTELNLSAIKVDAKIEIEDQDNIIVSPVEVSIVENSSSKTLFTSMSELGDVMKEISYASLEPDTEYTLYANASYEIDGIEYDKTFISKIFRTEALGVSFEKSYATAEALAIKVMRENYSSVSSVTLSIYSSSNERLDYSVIDFSSGEIEEIIFSGLDNNQEYRVVMHEIICQGVVVEGGYSIKNYYKTLKKAPSIGELKYTVDKKNNSFSLFSDKIEDEDYGIKNYRYEIYDARSNINETTPLVVINNKDATNVKANVDEVKLLRGVQYTYRLVLEFNDNEKIVEYSSLLPTTMQLDGVSYPTIKFDENYVTWEQINGVISVDDPSGAIVGDTFKVVYYNSLGIYTSKEIIADNDSGSIGININNLRANETYTFQVFADINLQDGNPTEEKAYIGSVFVQTKKPQPLVASYDVANSYSTAFSINFSLTNPEMKDSSLEASTLNELTFTLYQGTSIQGAREVSRRVVDVNQDDYVSTLKEMFYDDTSIINPSFFNTKNENYKERIYTLKVSGAYDYTTYKNEIEIENDTLTFDINSYIPDIPDDPNKAILPIKILNKAAESYGLAYDETLDPNTVVGYNLVTNYYNEAGNAVRMIYHVYVYNHLTNQYVHLDALDKSIDFDEDGNIAPVLYELGYGTGNDIFDNDKLRRGNDFYFTYEVMLDINGDGVEDSVYPKVVDETAVLRCENISAEKQSSKFKLYPSVSDNSSASYKYLYTDVDHALFTNKLFSYIGNAASSTSSANISENVDYQIAKFTSLKKNDFFTIKAQEKLLKNGTDKYNSLTSQYFYGLTSTLNLSYSANIEENKLVISIDDYYDKSDEVDKIVSADVKIKPVSAQSTLQEIIFTNQVFDSGNIFINLYDIASYLSTPFSVDVTIYSDSGNTGFDVISEYKAIQNTSISANSNYYYINDSNKLMQNSSIVGSEFKTTFNPLATLVEITNKAGKSLELDFTIDETGVIYSSKNILFKELRSQALSSTEKTAQFDLIIPSVSLLNAANKLNILALLNTAEVDAKVSVASSTLIENNKIYIDLYKTDENGVNAEYVKTIEKTVAELANKFTITGLNPKTNYFINFKANVYDNESSSYVEYYLYDVDYKTSGYSYRFNTLSDVGISNIRVNFETISYNNKKIRFDYNLQSIHGYDYIEYKLYEKVNGEFVLVDINIPSSVAFFTNMSFNIDASPSNPYGFGYGKTYKIEITPVGHYNDNGVNKEINLGTKSNEFTLKDFEEPYIGISSSKTNDTIVFKVSIDDNTKILKNDKYNVKLMTSNYETIATINDIDSGIINKTFTFNKDDHHLIENELYIFVVTLALDYNNNGTNYTEKSQTKNIRFGDSVNLGSVSATRNSDSNYAIDIIFADSYKLSSVNKITYTVSSTSVSYFSTGTDDFVVRYDTNNNLYTYTMRVLENENFKSGIMYTITMNFYTDNELVAQDEISYFNGGAS